MDPYAICEIETNKEIFTQHHWLIHIETVEKTIASLDRCGRSAHMIFMSNNKITHDWDPVCQD